MSVRYPRAAWLAASLALGQLAALPLPAQTPPLPPGVPVQPSPKETQTAPRALSVYSSPVGLFRQLLLMSPADQQKFIADRPAQTQAPLLAKVQEYQSLPATQRELRLKATELRFYLVPLLSTPATNRAGQLALIPEDDRKLVSDRLQEWDALSQAQQKELLENVALLRYLTELQTGSEEHKRRVQENVPGPQRESLDRSIARWQALPSDRRAKILVQFHKVLELTPAEQEKSLQTLSEAERQEMEKTLTHFRSLPRSQREVCINSFQKFASMTREDRARFLNNAEQWRQMSPDQRQAWRNLVRNLPPLPAGFDSPPAPPLPRELAKPHAPLVTNTN